MQGEIFKMKFDRFFTRPACVYVHSLLPRVLPVGWESCQRARLAVDVSKGSGFEGKQGKNRGWSQNRINKQEDRALVFLDGQAGEEAPSYTWRNLGSMKGAELKEKEMAGSGEGPSETRLPPPSLVPKSPDSVLGWQSRTGTLPLPLSSKQSLSHLSWFHLLSLQTCRSTLDHAAAFQTFLKTLLV